VQCGADVFGNEETSMATEPKAADAWLTLELQVKARELQSPPQSFQKPTTRMVAIEAMDHGESLRACGTTTKEAAAVGNQFAARGGEHLHH